MNKVMTGHPIVDAIGGLNIEGNIIPHSWYRHIKYSNKRGTYTDPLACLILADLVYWYRPVEERDELTGELIGWRKKFADDLLRRSPSGWAEMFGVTVKQVRESMHLLEQLELVEVELKPHQTVLGTVPNVMFITLHPANISTITYRIIAKTEAPEKSLLPSSGKRKAKTLEKALLPKSATSNQSAETLENTLLPKSATSNPSAETLENTLLPKSAISNAEIGNKVCRNGQQAVPKSVTSRAEMGNLTIYRDYLEITSETTLSPQPPATWKLETEKRERETELSELEPDPGNRLHHLTPLQSHPGPTGKEPNFVVREECDAAAPTKFEIKATNPATEKSHFSPEPIGDELSNQGEDENSANATFSTVPAVEINAPAGGSHQAQPIGVEQKELGPDLCPTTAQPSMVPLLPPSRPPVQSQGKPRLNPNSRFHSQQEMDDFYQALKQLGKSKGISQPSAWAIAIIKGINSDGLPCEYLHEFRAGQMLGASEQEEWECEPGKPWPTFITFLTRRLKKTGLSDEEAISKAYATLRNRNQAQDLWASCKRLVLNLESQWQRDQALGVSNAYIPPELLPQEIHSVERAMSAMQEIQSHSIQALAPGAVPVTSPAPSVLPPSVAEPSTPSRLPSWDNLERSYSAKIGKAHVERVLQQNPDWGFQLVNGKISPSLEAVQRDYADPKTRAGVLKLLFLHPELGFEEVDGTITEVEF